VKLSTRADGAAERSTAAPSFGYTPAVLRRTIATQTWMVGVRAYLHARNALFGRAPDLGDALMRVTNVGGRGRGLEGDSGARYFHAVLEDYEFIAAHAGVVREPHELFRGRTLLELGPGNTRAVALLALSRGAHSWSGCDRFDVITDSEARLRPIYEPLLARVGEEPSMTRAAALLAGATVHRDPREFAAAGRRADLVLSRAVLEHVRDLDDLFASLREATTDDAVMIHKVDLRSHGFHLTNDLDFLRFSVGEWDAMTSNTGEPNRLRASDYLHLARRHGFAVAHFSAARTLPKSAVERVRPELAEPFASMSVDELAVVGIWLVLVREQHPLAATALQGVPACIPTAPVGLSSY
jgi:SAM-dependent methyltransferase